ncbi:MAG: T9SS type A sorting domain-containing protein [FCB group bacterium]|nr:T9SS type A sorting domain-containing protein [FCB group bacterium]
MENNNQILTNYLSTGGKLILSGNNLLYNWFRIWSGSWTAISSTPESNIELLGNYFQIDSAYTFYWPSIGPEHEIDSAISVTPNYPSLSVDSVKLAMISSLPPPMAYYYEVGGMIPTEEAEILYTFDAVLPDSSPLQNSAIGIKYFGENTAAAMFTFPLYGMEPYDSVKALARQILDDMYSYTDVERFMVKDYVPQFFKLKQNYPNPFNARTLIEFEVPYRSEVKIQVFNILGRNVAELADDVFSPGIYRVEFDGGELSSGIYFVSMSAGDFIRTQKMLLVK